MDAVSEARLQQVAPFLADTIHRLSTALQSEGIDIRVVQALRSWIQQDALYAQGRTIPGNIVTNVRGGYSWHNYGLAVDCVPSTGGSIYIPDWNSSHPSWKRMEAVGQSLGLDSGSAWRTFPDAPHFQMTGRFPEAEPDDEVRQIFKDGGMVSVWSEVTSSLS